MKTGLPTTTEAEFTAQVLEYARLRGWRTIHLRPARTARGWRTAVQGDGAGFPDVLALRGGRVVVAELKVARNVATEAQEAWLAAWREAGAEVFLWTPDAWAEIERVLT